MLYEAILFINSNLLLCFLVTQLQLLQGPIAILVGSTSRGMNAKNCYQLTAALMLNRERVYCCVLRGSAVSHHVTTADSHAAISWTILLMGMTKLCIPNMALMHCCWTKDNDDQRHVLQRM
mmetsp:Transcript_30834/g.65218  ORF Transcript_30834/g.65218 Transcript_30834/m.65218 type:complete len:121 (-) Transcript_30834:932-1294(-)